MNQTNETLLKQQLHALEKKYQASLDKNSQLTMTIGRLAIELDQLRQRVDPLAKTNSDNIRVHDDNRWEDFLNNNSFPNTLFPDAFGRRNKPTNRAMSMEDYDNNNLFETGNGFPIRQTNHPDDDDDSMPPLVSADDDDNGMPSLMTDDDIAISQAQDAYYKAMDEQTTTDCPPPPRLRRETIGDYLWKYY